MDKGDTREGRRADEASKGTCSGAKASTRPTVLPSGGDHQVSATTSSAEAPLRLQATSRSAAAGELGKRGLESAPPFPSERQQWARPRVGPGPNSPALASQNQRVSPARSPPGIPQRTPSGLSTQLPTPGAGEEAVVLSTLFTFFGGRGQRGGTACACVRVESDGAATSKLALRNFSS